MPKTARVLTGQVAAITGGARGIGRATAQAMVRKGMKVAIGDVDAELARQTAEELGAGMIALELDVTDRESFERFIEEAESELGPVDVLVNNAGIMPTGRFLDETDASTQRQIDINVGGVLNGMKIVLPRFEQRGRGHLVNIASVAGKGGFPGVATYCGTKHFVVGVTEAVHGELLDTDIEVTCVMPAVVRTELTAGIEDARGVKSSEPEDVAEAIVGALEFPRFDVFVPKSAGRLNAIMGVVPRRAREGMAKFLKADKVVLEADMNERRAYEERAARSEPALAPEDEDKVGV